MKILHLVEDLRQIGGREQFLTYLLPKLKAYGLNIELAVMDSKLNLVYEDAFKRHGIRVHYLSGEEAGSNSNEAHSRFIRTLRAIGVLKIIFKKGKPDIIHSHLPVPSVLPFLTSLKIPKIATIHGPFLVQFARKKIAAWLALQVEVVINRFARTRYIAISSAIKQDIHTRLKVPEKRIRVIYNSIDLREFKVKSDLPSKTSPLIIQIGSFTPVKGHLTSLKAFQIVKKFYPESKLLFVGEGFLRPVIEKRIKEMRLNNSVHVLGVRNDVPKILLEADVCWIPSEWEGFSLVCLEAMASGLPVIASAVGGLIELISDGETGYLIPPGSAELLASKTLTILRNPALGKKLGLAARQTAEERFNIEKTTEEYISAYRDILQGRW